MTVHDITVFVYKHKVTTRPQRGYEALEMFSSVQFSSDEL